MNRIEKIREWLKCPWTNESSLKKRILEDEEPYLRDLSSLKKRILEDEEPYLRDLI